MRARAALCGAVVLATASVICALVAVVMWVAWGNASPPIDLPGLATDGFAIDAAAAVLWCVPGVLILRRRPDLPFGWLSLLAAFGHGVSALGTQLAFHAMSSYGSDLALRVGLWAGVWGPVIELPVLAVIYTSFPDARRSRGWAGMVGIGAVALTVAGVVATVSRPLADSLGVSSASRSLNLTTPVFGSAFGWMPPAVPLLALGMLAACGVAIVRWRRASGDQRLVLSWLAVAAFLGPLVVLAVALFPSGVGFAVAELETILEIAVVTSIAMRRHVYGVDLAVQRVVVYGALITLLVGVHATVTALADRTSRPSNASLLAAITVAVVAIPARDRLQRLATRVLYGDRDDPVLVLSRLSTVLRAARTPQQLVDGVVLDVARTLRLPYIHLEVTTVSPPLRASTGPEPSTTVGFALVHDGAPVGNLVVSPRSGERQIGSAEQHVLTQAATQIATAIAALSMAIELQRSRESIVAAVEEERRRLRRELHDSLGPSLTASAYQVDTARALLSGDVAKSDHLLDGVRQALSSSIADIRQLVHGLRPSAIDDLGFLAAMHQRVEMVGSGTTMTVTMTAPDTLPPLPAAVEVAAYLIVGEAVTNAVRHSGGSACRVTLTNDQRRLNIVVADDGGSAAWNGVGVGVTSMHERAAALGGSCTIGPVATGGQVVVQLPLQGSDL